MIRMLLFAAMLCATTPALADTLVLKPSRVFDGINPRPHENWSVLVEGDKIALRGRRSKRLRARASSSCPERRSCRG
jgi:hypothetical protein